MITQQRITAVNQQKKRFQFSIRSILIAMTLAGLALVNPGFAMVAPFVISISVIIVALIVLVAAVSVIVTGDRRMVLSWAWRNVWTILAVNAILLVYLIYAINMLDWIEQ